MKPLYTNILILSDIEGSSGCWDYDASSFLTKAWCHACLEMSRDVDAVGRALLDAGADQVAVKDFHRSGFNLLPERIDPRVRVVPGYHRKPVPGIGDPGPAQAVMFLGMHAASGTHGFLAHTLTSRMERLVVNGRPMPEVELFAASLAPWGIQPIFFSGCPVACHQAEESIAGIRVYPIDKSVGMADFEVRAWRAGLAKAAVESLANHAAPPYRPVGPFHGVVRMRDGEKAARRVAKRWGFVRQGDRIILDAQDIHALYRNLIRLCYLTPATERMLPLGLHVYHLWGRLGLAWARRQLRAPQRRHP